METKVGAEAGWLFALLTHAVVNGNKVNDFGGIKANAPSLYFSNARKIARRVMSENRSEITG